MKTSPLPSIYLAGDSTVCDYPPEKAPMTGWGQALAEQVKPGVRVVNLAAPGRSTKSFQTEGRWQNLLGSLAPGDWVIIQFGHNDQKLEQPELYAGVDTDYPANLRQFVHEVRERRANPVLCTSVQRRHFRDGEFQQSLGRYPEVMRETAQSTGTPLIDLNIFTEKLFLEAGDEGSRAYLTILEPGEYPGYPDGVVDNSHYSLKGARLVASEVIRSVREQKLSLAELFL